jgi:nicotinamidase-related amidase
MGLEPMDTKLFITDPQNDFCDIESAALPVPGASADLERLSTLVARSGDAVTEITVTLDSHPCVAIERVTFWRRADGEPVAPFTEISTCMVRQGRYLPRRGELLSEVVEYLRRLEAQGRYRLMVWPVHCVLGTPGHNLYAPLARALADWEVRTQRPVAKVLKGSNPLTEHYSAIRAEVPRQDDPGTGVNDRLIERARPAAGERLLVAGEASSHCVRATVLDLLEAFSAPERSRTVLLTDCMSPVAGFEAQARTFLSVACAAGVRLMSCEEALAALEQDRLIR